MKYMLDTMLNGLKKYLVPAGIQAFTANYLIRNSEDSSVEIPHGRLFRFVLENKYDLVPKKDPELFTIVTSDKELEKYCNEFEIPVHKIERPSTRNEFKKAASLLIRKITENRLSV